ncbi:Hypothetical predicted protein [Olea europaea subsp. europaea]|uniref:Uncharacterized protein n=1 Tax=Olea europaea subsp. europaea TaxID=158383 RepID=A0A8S0TBF1_OLEEU|nr:Hypothetical predicted protein [Olea europaea subsp. europaea]
MNFQHYKALVKSSTNTDVSTLGLYLDLLTKPGILYQKEEILGDPMAPMASKLNNGRI